MENIFIKIWLPLLLISLLAAAVYFGSDSVETFDPQTGRGTNIPLEPAFPLAAQYDSQPRGRSVSQKSSVSIAESRLAIDEHYASLKDLMADQKAAGFVRIGYFGKFWPARVTEIQYDNDGISFIRQDGTRHTYRKFDGYRIKMVRLSAGAKETIVIFRSQMKR